ncbi:MAG: hypothetical protein OdinLCB4_006620 [Candidatus Odinarchaeum yellowstonii]|uniref:Uncharacterized protein n=1 Tax=Odinarchaeota yellowstonii (strain LCB_4) TaxID=1841599 RepID=A0AAF0D1V4_ODILC|nr:MAG: hypothetical protein OdinLCB4_006620 [Candidatus Odinarchaeum yellowstonii]
MKIRAVLAFILGLIASWGLIYFLVLGGSLTDLVNILTGGLEGFKGVLFNVCVIQFSAFPLVLIGDYILMIVLVFTGLLIGVICGGYKCSLIVVFFYSLIVFLTPFIVLVSGGYPPFLALTQILFLFIGHSLIYVVLNFIAYEAVLILPALLGAALI